MSAGTLAGLRVVEFAGIGPCPFAGMMLADMGADVVRVDRTGAPGIGLQQDPRFDILNRGKRSVALDLKSAEGRTTALDLAAAADAVIEGFRPGVMERLGLGPDVCLARNPRLVFGRVTGWGQSGPEAQKAGHDINYIALTGVLAAIGRSGEPPLPPLNLVGDFGGGGMLLAVGVLAALLSARVTGCGQVVDAAMSEGALLLMGSILGLRAEGAWVDARGSNAIDTGAPFYDVYPTADGGYLAIGAIEDKFFGALLSGLGLDAAALPAQWDRSGWPQLKVAIGDAVRSRSRAAWTDAFASLDACVTPVLSLNEAAAHPHVAARGAFETASGVLHPAPAPRFAATPSAIRGEPPALGAHTDAALADWGIAAPSPARATADHPNG